MGITWHFEAERQRKEPLHGRLSRCWWMTPPALAGEAVFVNRKRRQLCSQSCLCPATPRQWELQCMSNKVSSIRWRIYIEKFQAPPHHTDQNFFIFILLFFFAKYRVGTPSRIRPCVGARVVSAVTVNLLFLTYPVTIERIKNTQRWCTIKKWWLMIF